MTYNYAAALLALAGVAGYWAGVSWWMALSSFALGILLWQAATNRARR